MWLIDGLVNLVAGLGSQKDAKSATHWWLHLLDRNQLEQMYRSDWLARAIVDAPADDASRNWRKWQASDKQIDAIEALERRFELQKKYRQAKIRARLYGGAALVIGVDQGQPDEELDYEQVGLDDLKFVVVVNRYELNAGPRIYNVMSRWYTRPEYYTISTPLFGWSTHEQGTVYPTLAGGKSAAVTPRREQGQAPEEDNVIVGPFGKRRKPRQITQEEGDPARQQYPAQGLVRIHPSRVIEFWGNELPDWRLAPMGGGWGDSVLQTAEDACRAFGTSMSALGSMVVDGKVDVIKIPQFTQNLAAQSYTDRLIQRFTLANTAKSTVNALLLDKEEDWERIQTELGGMPGVIDKLALVAAAAGGIPLSRLMKQSPGGSLNAKGSAPGEVDLRNYFDEITADQKNVDTPIMEPLDQCLVRSAIGKWDKNVKYEWVPLYEPDPLELAQIAFQKAQTTELYVNMGLFNEDLLRTAASNQIQEDNLYPGWEDAVEEFGEEPEEPNILMPAPQQSASLGKTGVPQPVNPMRRPDGQALENVAANQRQSAAQ